MLVRPNLTSHESCQGTLFDRIELWAKWHEGDDGYAFTRVTLTHHRQTTWGKDDLRYKPHTFGFDFQDFTLRIRLALSHIDDFAELYAATPKGAHLSKSLGSQLRLTSEGIYLADWQWAPIYDQRAATPKLAAMAVLELLEIEAGLPSYQL